MYDKENEHLKYQMWGDIHHSTKLILLNYHVIVLVTVKLITYIFHFEHLFFHCSHKIFEQLLLTKCKWQMCTLLKYHTVLSKHFSLDIINHSISNYCVCI